MTVPPTTQNKGRLVLCPEGQRLYDEYCVIYDDPRKTDDGMIRAWDAYYEHHLECDDCGYV